MLHCDKFYDEVEVQERERTDKRHNIYQKMLQWLSEYTEISGIVRMHCSIFFSWKMEMLNRDAV